MTPAQPNRRRFLSSGAMALGTLAAPLSGFGAGQTGPDWPVTLERRLRSFSTGITRIQMPSGEVELHCRMPDLAAFGSSHGNLAGLGLKATARGNTMSLERDGFTLKLVLLTDAPLPFRATFA